MISGAFGDPGWVTYALGRPEWQVKCGAVSSNLDGEGPVVMEHPEIRAPVWIEDSGIKSSESKCWDGCCIIEL